ncbi:alpha-mannosidase [Saccharomycopsis crataegensis]|uniref:Alpha-mannosidase n=1 Tax=Saccharomycopsis crataegensis TaxID=43959 RepID=A0AAV5QSU6_9ASCO|nr:alpha-mannosidase [Saccharomycopsis crataegensis]
MVGSHNLSNRTSNASDGYSQINNAPQFKHIDNIYSDRLRQFTDEGQYRDFNLPRFYDKARIDHSKDDGDVAKGYISLKVHSVPDLKRPLFRDLIPNLNSDDWHDTSKGANFGPSWSTHWFKINAKVPDSWVKEDVVLLNWDGNNEGLVYTVDGEPLQAFTGGGERCDFILPKEWYQGGKDFNFYIEVSCNGMFGNGPGTIDPPDPNRYFTLSRADLVIPNLAARDLHIDFWELGDSAREMPGDSWQKHKARTIANEIMNAFDANNPEESIKKCTEIAATYVGENSHNSKVYENTDYKTVDVFGVGNCHIDTAWLWPFAETKRKVMRSWTTQVDLLNRYPEYVFVASQAQQFRWLKHDSPIAFGKVKEKVEEGRFIPIGGSWVENDTNMPSGESLGRQFLKGQFFFKQNFGIFSDTFWLPDTFGYSSQVPQLCRLSYMDRFLTQKLSWNNINSFPLTTFNWCALDGSQVLTHMPPNNTYTSDANWGDVKRSLSQHKNLAYDQKGLMLYGHGDGGGGPSPEQIDKLRRCRGISETVGGMPKVHVGNTIKEFYDIILKNTDNGSKLPAWNGELYFEFHRGTYTTQSKMKKFVRWSEFNLRDLEYFATIASLFKKSYSYPKNELCAFWEDLLLCQFHDVLPGSCIEMVYDDAKPMLSNVIHKSHDLTLKALKALGIKDLVYDSNQRKYSGGAAVNLAEVIHGEFNLLNSFPWKRSEVLKIPKVSSMLDDNEKLKNKVYSDAKAGKFIQEGLKHDYVYVSTDESNNHIMSPLTSKIKHASLLTESSSHYVLCNSKLKVSIDKKTGVISSLYDLSNDKEVLDIKSGSNTTGANQFVMLNDTPLGWQGWDTELFSLEKITPLTATSVTKYEAGPLRSSVKVVIDIPVSSTTSKASKVVSIISLAGINDMADLSFVEFENKVVWNENCKFLKVEFPVDIHNEYASYETQFGITKRPTHYNTSWDVAKFEVCHHKFADYSEFGYGVSIINDCKYGFSTHGNLMRLSLLRAPKQPDGHADMDTHFIKYAIFPHKGQLGADTVKLGNQLNSKLVHNSLDDSDGGANCYKLKPVVTGCGEPDVSLIESGFGTNLVVNKVNEFTENFFDFISIKGDENIVLSNMKRYEYDDDVFYNYAPDVLDDKEMLLKQRLSSTNNKVSKKEMSDTISGTKSVVLRAYEALGGKSRGTIYVKKLLEITRVTKVNNLEEDVEELAVIESSDKMYYTIDISLRAFEIAGYRIEFKTQ